MKTLQLALITGILIVAACKSKKNTSTSSTTTTSAVATNTSTVSTGPAAQPKSNDGIYEPGSVEVWAIQGKYADVTLEKLKKGHELYTAGACITCHNAKNIYRRDEQSWKLIMDDMAARAKLTEEEKDAVYKYVLAIKATQPK